MATSLVFFPSQEKKEGEEAGSVAVSGIISETRDRSDRKILGHAAKLGVLERSVSTPRCVLF